MLAIAGVITWLGYTVLTYGLSQLAGGNYTIGDLAIPGRFTLGNPAPDPKAGTTSPCQPGYSVVAGKCVQNAPPGSGTNTGYKTKAACQAAAAAAGTKGTCSKSAGGTWYVATAAGH